MTMIPLRSYLHIIFRATLTTSRSTVARLAPIKSGTQCPFAKAAKICGGKDIAIVKTNAIDQALRIRARVVLQRCKTLLADQT